MKHISTNDITLTNLRINLNIYRYLTNTVIILLSVKTSDLLFYSDITKDPLFINSFISFNKYSYNALVNVLNVKETIFT